MPVRFRCVYCNQLLGIAKRKAGTVVRCTNCDGQIIVPDPEEQAPVAASSGTQGQSLVENQSTGPRLFERSDIDDLLRPFQQSNEFTGFTTSEPAEPSDLHAIPETAKIKKTSAEPPALPKKPWLVIFSAVALALFFFGLGFFVARWTG